MSNFSQGVKNIIKWFPVIWKDKDYDYCFLLTIMEKKFEFMEEFFNNSAIVASADKTAKQLNLSKFLLKRLREDKYGDKCFDDLHKKWGEPYMSGSTIKIPNIKTEEDEEKYSKELQKSIELSVELRKADKELFCKYFMKHLETWWD